jgi:methyl-accepting chemotaxis protein
MTSLLTSSCCPATTRRLNMRIHIRTLKLSQKLAVSFGAVLLLLLGLTALSLERLERIGQSMVEVSNVGAKRSQAVRLMERSANRFGAVLRGMPTAPADSMASMLKALDESLIAHKEGIDKARALVTDPAALALIDGAAKASAAVEEVVVLARKESGDRGEMAVAFTVRLRVSSDHAMWNDRLGQWTQVLTQLSSWDDATALEVSERSAQVASSARGALVGGALLALVLSAGLGLWITRDVTAGLHQAVTAAKRMAQYDLATPVNVSRGDEIGSLLHALDDMRLRQLELVVGVSDVARSIHQSSSEISSGTHDLSDRTEQAAATLERVSSNIQMLVGSVNETTQSVVQANSLSGNANNDAERGGRTVSDAVSTMAQVADSSSKIVEIISMIDGVAFQTNILALNAAVEAARAGEQGRGFAVVASEVRSLAQRTAKASHEVKRLIEDAREKISIGSKQIHVAGETTRQVLNSVHSVSTIIASISKSAGSQMSGIDETRRAVEQLESIAQQNAAMAEQSAAATGSMNQQVQRLTTLIGNFKLHVGSQVPASV